MPHVGPDEWWEDDLVTRRPEPVASEEELVPRLQRRDDGEEAGHDVADGQLAPEHVDVGHRVGGGVAPRRLRGELPTPGHLLELLLALLADAGHRFMVVADGRRVEDVLTGSLRHPLREHEPSEGD